MSDLVSVPSSDDPAEAPAAVVAPRSAIRRAAGDVRER